MKRMFSFKIQEELYKRFKERAKKLNISMGSLIRMLISQYLEG